MKAATIHIHLSTIHHNYIRSVFVVILSGSFSLVFFPIGLGKTKSDFIVGSVETRSGRLTLVVAVISADAYPFLVFSDLTCHLEDTGVGVFWLHCAACQTWK